MIGKNIHTGKDTDKGKEMLMVMGDINDEEDKKNA